jgi:hypothetical protein
MAKMVINGIRPWDGEYDLVSDRAFNAREWRIIKQHSGYLPMTVSDGFAGEDPDLFVALAVVAMIRAGRIRREEWEHVADQISEAPFDGSTLTMIGDPVEADDDLPLDLTPTPAEPSLVGSS